MNYGHRWRIPQISLIIKLLFNCWINKPRYIHCIGLTFEIKLALKFLKKYKLVVWETTEANKENRFVYHGIIPYLKHAIMILAPSQTIKQNILTNYQYSGIINILPFWTDWLPKIYVTDKKRTGHLLYVGRLDIDKGFDCLFNALRQLNNKFNLHIDICGRGNIDSIKKLAYNLEKVTFHGFANNKNW